MSLLLAKWLQGVLGAGAISNFRRSQSAFAGYRANGFVPNFFLSRDFFFGEKEKITEPRFFFQDLISSSLEKLLNQVFRDSRFAAVGDRQFPAEARQSETDMKVSPFVSTTTTTAPTTTTTTTTPVATTTATSSESAVTRSRPSFCHLYPKA